MDIGKNIKTLRRMAGLTQDELGRKIGVSSKTVSSWEINRTEPSMGMVQKMSEIFNCSKETIISDGEIRRPGSKGIRIPVFGSVPAGIPKEAIPDIVKYENIPEKWSGHEFIGVVVRGDSMEPLYMDGDTVIVRIQPDCECGQDCVVYIDGYDATLKRIIKNEEGIMVQPLNPKYPPRHYRYDGGIDIKILGVAVQLRRDL